jgi:gp16 family phage-associated protein
MEKEMAVKTLKEANNWFKENGLTRKQWAELHGFNYAVVIDVLRGHSIGNYGDAHQVAVKLGLKPIALQKDGK